MRTAAEVFGVPPDVGHAPSSGASPRRSTSASSYGQSDFGLSQVLGIPRAAGAAVHRQLLRALRRRAPLHGARDRRARVTPARSRRCSGAGARCPRSAPRARRHRSYGERIARNTPIQGSAADLLKLAMIRVDAALEAARRDSAPGAELLLTVHDELVFEVPEAAVDTFKQWVKNEMESVYLLKVPLVVDVGAGPTWGQAH